ncbi:MAG: hypothetical protein PHE03_12835 [Bacteroidales bacterium]|nr:hypothetical protein [Bacteroidales bacterium]
MDNNSFSEISLFPETPSKVTLSHEYWGGYSLITFSGQHKGLKTTRRALFGSSWKAIDPVALYMTDKNSYLSVCGNSEVVGYCFLPELRMRSARFEGNLFNGSIEQREDYIKVSDKKLPPPPDYLIDNTKAILNGDITGERKSKDFLIGQNELFNSFDDTLLIIGSADTTWSINNITLSGKILVHSDYEIVIEPNAKLNGVIVAAPKIVVKSGVDGNAQLFASDTIIIEQGAKLTYPSIVGVLGGDGCKSLVHIKESSTVHGVVWIYSHSSKIEEIPQCLIDENAKVLGQVYSSGFTQHKGRVWGTLMVDLFTLRTDYAYYENFIYNAEVNSQKLPISYACVPFIFNYPEMQFIDWVY